MSSPTANKKRKEADPSSENDDSSDELAETKQRLVNVEAELLDTKKQLAAMEDRATKAEALVKELQQKTSNQEEDFSDDEEEEEEETATDSWSLKFRELREYRILNGDCNVPRKGANPKLAIWVKDQKALYKGKKGSKKLSPERVAKLESLGICWGKDCNPPPTWESQLEELSKYKKAMGSCNVHINPKSPSPLAKWVCAQRAEYKRLRKGKDSLLTMEQVGQLKELGFSWKGPKLA